MAPLSPHYFLSSPYLSRPSSFSSSTNYFRHFRQFSIKIRGSSSSSQLNPKVVVTRERGKNVKLINALAKHDIQCLEFPLIEHAAGPDSQKLQSTLTVQIRVLIGLLSLLQRQGWFFWMRGEWNVHGRRSGEKLLFSCFGLYLLCKLLIAILHLAAGSPNVKIGAVGAGSASVFKDVLQSSNALEIAFTPSKATAKVLASELPKGMDEKCTVLYPASAKAGSEIETGLSARGFDVKRLNTYTTVGVRHVDALLLEQAIATPVLAVASPSAIRAWVEVIPSVEQWTNGVACIGETTGVAAQRLGLQNVYYPLNPGLEGWVSSILDALKVHDHLQKA